MKDICLNWLGNLLVDVWLVDNPSFHKGVCYKSAVHAKSCALNACWIPLQPVSRLIIMSRVQGYCMFVLTT